MSQIEKIREKLQKDFPGTYTVFDEEVMQRIKQLQLPVEEENPLLEDLAILEMNFPGSANEWLDSQKE